MRKLVFFTLGFVVAMLLFATDYSKILVIGGSLLLVTAVFWRLKLKYPVKSCLCSCCGLLLGSLYFWGYTSYYYAPLEPYYRETIAVEGLVLDFPTEESYSYSLLAEVTLPHGKAKALFYVGDEGKDLKVGDRFWTEVELRTASETFQGNEITYYIAKGIMLRGVASGDLRVESPDWISPRHWPAYMAKWLKEGILSVFSPEYQGTVLALVTGNRDGLSDDFSASLERTGLSHTVAVSGMHLAFLAALLRLFLPTGRRWTSFFVIFVMIFFMLISGSTPSIMRATVMIVMLHLAPLFGRERDDSTALAAALLVILIQNPYSITHVGLHLSVASVAGIFLFSRKILDYAIEKCRLDWHYKTPIWTKFFFSSISATFGAMVITTPMVGFYFGTISLIAPFSNLMTLWAISAAFAGGLLSGILGAICLPLGVLFSKLFLPLLAYIQWIVPTLSSSVFAGISMNSIYYQLWLGFVYLVLAITFLIKWKKRIPFAFLLCSFSFFVAFLCHRFTYFNHEMSMEVFDVGQGQCILFTMDETFIVSDCGGNSYENAGDMVADTVQSLGRNEVALVVLSHCDADHVNGVVQLMSRLQVEAIAMPTIDEENPLQMEIVEKARYSDTEIWIIEEETAVDVGEGKSLTIYPTVGTGERNNTGITLLVSSGETDVLVTGDMNIKTEELLIETYPLPDIEILVVGHHGSKYSSSELFLDSIQAEVAVISVSATNTYGHPTEEVLYKLEAREMEIYRTDFQGKIRLTTES